MAPEELEKRLSALRAILDAARCRYAILAHVIQTALPTILDERLAALRGGYGGCGVPGHTLRIHIDDLIRITRARVFDFTESKE